MHVLLQRNIESLTDIRFIYNNCSTEDKQKLLSKVFDNRLYYQDKVYRTPYIMDIF